MERKSPRIAENNKSRAGFLRSWLGEKRERKRPRETIEMRKDERLVNAEEARGTRDEAKDSPKPSGTLRRPSRLQIVISDYTLRLPRYTFLSSCAIGSGVGAWIYADCD